MARRFLRFNLAGALGIGVQMGTLWLCLERASLHYLAATGVAVGAAVLHNFIWHWRWTWRDRAIPAAAAPAALARFVLANGAVSLATNLIVVGVAVGAGGLPAGAANLVAIGVGGLINFYLGDRAVFRRADSPGAAIPTT